jgi:Bacterial Ig domain
VIFVNFPHVWLISVLLVSASFASTALAQSNPCKVNGFFIPGYDFSVSGLAKSGVSCPTGFISGEGQFKSASVIKSPANGTVKLSAAGSGAPIVTYTSRRGFTGSDSFTIEVRIARFDDTAGVPLPDVKSRFSYTFNVMP